MTIELLELAHGALGELVDEVVFVGGATVALWITDPAAPPVRVTEDVDVIVEVTSRSDYYKFEERLRQASFREEQTVICRWLHRDTGLVLDAMPADAGILGSRTAGNGSPYPTRSRCSFPRERAFEPSRPPICSRRSSRHMRDAGRATCWRARTSPTSSR